VFLWGDLTKYDGEIKEGIFLERHNRFEASVLIDGEEIIVHVKNTGRCKEILIPGVTVYLVRGRAGRKTPYDLVAVKKETLTGTLLLNIDSAAPNEVAAEWLRGNLFSSDALIRREVTFGRSRFDFYVEDGETKAFVEVKGVTLEENGAYKFPDAKTERGTKHLNELILARRMGFSAYVLFVIQGAGAKIFSPNVERDPDFAEALKRAKTEGVSILCYDCLVGVDFMQINKSVEVVV
jgi:sugar fermentation stimulation protein